MKKKKTFKELKRVAVKSAATVFTSLTPAMVAAQDYLPEPTVGDTDLITFIKRVLNLAISIAALIAVGILIYSGILYITAAGDDGKIEKATKGITYAVVGLIIAFVSILIVNFVVNDVLKAN